MKQLLLFLSVLLSGLSCLAQSSPADTAQQINLDTLTVSSAASGYRGAATREWEIVHTRIALTFDWAAKTAAAKEWITLHPYCYATDTLVLDAKSIHIDTVAVAGKKGLTPLHYTYANNQVKIFFGCVHKMNDTIQLYLRYTSIPYGLSAGGSDAITDDRGLYFINTDHHIPHKPAQIWTQGETESNSHWLVTIDKPNSRFTTQVELTVPDSCVTLSNGELVKQLKGANTMRTDIWKMNMPIQAYAVMFAIGRFAVVKDHWRNKEVSYYVEPPFAPYAAKMFNHTPEMMEYFSTRTGVPFPWNKYSQVVVRDYVSGAMENTSASLFGEFMNQDAREIADRNSEDVVSHELFHQWFGDYVTARSWSNLTVNESFANYGEQLWRAYKYGTASADELAFNDVSGYLRAAQYSDPQLVRYYYDSREDVFDPISYNKGGAILRYLNNLIGDAAFDRAMNIYLAKNALHSAEAHNWRQAVEEATGQDWNVFFNQWYFHPGHPVLQVDYNYNDSLKVLGVSVAQVQNDSPFLYHLPLKTAIISGSGKTIVDWNITRRKDTFTYFYKNGIRPVIVPDYNHLLPGEIKEDRKPEQWLAVLVNSEDYVNKRMAVTAAGKLLSDSCSQLIVDVALTDPIPSIRRLTLTQLKNAKTDNYYKRWTDKVVAMAAHDSNNLVRAEALSVLGYWKVQQARQLLLSAVYDSSYTVGGNALDAISKMDTDAAYVIAKQVINTHPRSTLEYIVWTIIGNKGIDEDIALFETRVPYVFGAKKFTFATALAGYLKNVKSDSSFQRGINIFCSLILNESLRSYRGTIAGDVFKALDAQKEKSKSGSKEDADAAARRLATAKKAMQNVITAETDTENLKDFKQRFRDLYE